MSTSTSASVRIGDTDESVVELIASDTALLSLRSSGHDYCSAIGEVIDNSLQANANNIRCKIFTEKKIIGKNKRAMEVVDGVAVGDDGDGMHRGTLHNALKLSYSSRYNDRNGLGRFSIGAKMGRISQAKQIHIYSRELVDDPWLHTFIDLDEISSGEMKVIPSPEEDEISEDYKDLVDKTDGKLAICCLRPCTCVVNKDGQLQRVAYALLAAYLNFNIS